MNNPDHQADYRSKLNRSREMWQRTNSTGSFVSLNPLALLDKNGRLKDPIELSDDSSESPINNTSNGSMNTETMLKLFLKKNGSHDSLNGIVKSESKNESISSDETDTLSDTWTLSDTYTLSDSGTISDGFSLSDTWTVSDSFAFSDSSTSTFSDSHSVEIMGEPNRYATIDATMRKNYRTLTTKSSTLTDETSRKKLNMFQCPALPVFDYRKSVLREAGIDLPEKTKINGKLIVYAGTITSLISEFIVTEEIDMSYLHEFLFTYRFFVSPIDLMAGLIYKHWFTDDIYAPQQMRRSRSNEEVNTRKPLSSQQVDDWRHFRRLRVINSLRKWVILHPYDFEIPEVEEAMKKFLEQNQSKGNEEKYLASLQELFNKRKPEQTKSTLVDFEYSLPPKERVELNGKSFLSFKPEIMAQQLALIESTLLQEIMDYEIFDQIENSDNPIGDGLARIAQWSNKMHLWVSAELCIAKEKDRVSVLKRLLLLAKYSKDLNNFNALFEIVTGLQLQPVQRLTKTWKNLPSKFKLIWQELNQVVCKDGNCKLYEKFFAEAIKLKQPVIPAIRVFLSDVIEEAERLPTYLDEAKNKINFIKFHNIGKHLVNLRHCQETKYNFKYQEIESKWLQHATILMDINDILRLSTLEV